MTKSFLTSIIILPGITTVLVPAFLLYCSSVFFRENIGLSENIILLVVSIVFIAFGFFLAETTVRLFSHVGDGTLAPWDPPKKLVITGSYRYVRNPMITGIFFILFGEALMFWSLVLFLWAVIFLIANVLYLPFVEEKRLRKRFGVEYDEYVKQVPRWIPRLTPWEKRK